jgi:hypothetical protein
MPRTSALAACLVAALAACGGGSDAPADPNALQISYSSNPLRTSTFDDSLSSSPCERVTLSPVPTQSVTVRVTDSGATWQPGPLSVYTQPDGTFLACLHYQSTLVAGSHTGTLTVQICKDTACAQPYTLSQPVLPYEVMVYHVVTGQPPLDAVIKLDGVVTPDVSAGVSGDVRTYAVTMRSGHTLEVDPSEAFVQVGYNRSGYTAPLSMVSMQPTAVVVSATLPAGLSSGTNTLWGRSVDGQTIEVAVTVTP